MTLNPKPKNPKNLNPKLMGLELCTLLSSTAQKQAEAASTKLHRGLFSKARAFEGVYTKGQCVWGCTGVRVQRPKAPCPPRLNHLKWPVRLQAGDLEHYQRGVGKGAWVLPRWNTLWKSKFCHSALKLLYEQETFGSAKEPKTS